MMKFHSVIVSSAAVLLGVPVVVAGQDEVATLRAALASTDNSLGILQQLAHELTGGTPPARESVLEVTEPPILDGPMRDRRLNELRGQVGLLTSQLDEAEAMREPEAFVAAAKDRVVYGFDDDVRRALRTLGLSNTAPKVARKDTSQAVVEPIATEATVEKGPTYSADPLGQARALFHAKRFDRVIEILAPFKEDAKALYWRGRALEKLGRFDEALSSLEAAKARSTDDLLTRLVETDIEFVTWRKESFPQVTGDSQ